VGSPDEKAPDFAKDLAPLKMRSLDCTARASVRGVVEKHPLHPSSSLPELHIRCAFPLQIANETFQTIG
jgi:hypothetical protein